MLLMKAATKELCQLLLTSFSDTILTWTEALPSQNSKFSMPSSAKIAHSTLPLKCSTTTTPMVMECLTHLNSKESTPAALMALSQTMMKRTMMTKILPHQCHQLTENSTCGLLSKRFQRPTTTATSKSTTSGRMDITSSLDTIALFMTLSRPSWQERLT